MSGINPQAAMSIRSSADHARTRPRLSLAHLALRAERGRIGIFNRSYYEETLVVRVHPEFLAEQKVPIGIDYQNIWKERFEDINAFERYLGRNGIVGPQVFPARLEGGAKAAVPFTAR